MKKKKWSRVLPVLLVMVTVISLLPGCGRKRAEKEDAETITVYLWSTNLYEKYAPYIQEQLPDINVEFVVGNNDLDFYKFLDENGGLPDIITCCRFSLHSVMFCSVLAGSTFSVMNLRLLCPMLPVPIIPDILTAILAPPVPFIIP